MSPRPHAARGLALLLVVASIAAARDIHVNHQIGDDAGAGSAEAPLRTVSKAVSLAKPGDVIHLLPEKSVYREAVSIKGKTGITIDGHGCTLDGADPLPADGWETVGDDLRRRAMPRPYMGRHLLIIDGRCQRMNRSPSRMGKFPAPEVLKPGEFAFVDTDEKTGWLYLRGPVDKLEWAVRPYGIGTSGMNRDITIRDLHTRHALNDGFNVHGDTRGLRCSRISGYDCFDEGFSAHDTCEAWIEDGEFHGNDNAVADVNTADTFYTRCSFRDSVSVEVLFNGGKHSLDHCTITAAGPTAFSLTPGGLGREPQKIPGVCAVRDTTFTSVPDKPRRFAVDRSTATFENCRIISVEISLREAKVTAANTTLDGKPWQP